VTAIQCWPYSVGFWVRPWAWGPPNITLALTIAVIAVRANPVTPGRIFWVFFGCPCVFLIGRPESIWQTLRRRTLEAAREAYVGGTGWERGSG